MNDESIDEVARQRNEKGASKTLTIGWIDFYRQ